VKRSYEGGCHCGRVRFRVTADLARVTECNCSICSKKGFLHLIVPLEAFELISGKDALTTYRFNTGVARHTFCATCGIHPFSFRVPIPTRSMSMCVALTVSISQHSPLAISMAATGKMQ
jgi:hypothetical protein